MVQNKALLYKKVPSATPQVGEHIAVQDWSIDEGKLEDGGVFVKILYSSVDPYMRGRLRQPGTKSYVPAFELDQPLTTSSIVKVVKSKSQQYKEGDLLRANTPIANYAILGAETLKSQQDAHKLDNPHNLDPVHYLGALGMPGMTAYSSFYEIGQPKKGETIFVSSAAGAVGQLVCQLALHEGLEVVASVGDDAKVEMLQKELGLKNITNYKKEETADALKRLAPKGVDIYYDNVGGKMLEDALDAMNDHGRIVACGAISQYNLRPEERYGVRNLFLVVGKQLTYRGFLVFHLAPKYQKSHNENVGKWIADGSFKPTLHITNGIDKSGDALLELFSGANLGKAVIKIAE